MKRSILSLLGLSIFALSVSAQDKLELTAKMPELINDDVVYLWNPIDKTTDSTYVKNNSFSFTNPMKGGGSTFILQAGKNPEKTGLGMVVYLEGGKMNIVGNGTGFKGATFSGDAFVADWIAMEKAMAESYANLDKIDALSIELAEAKKIGDESAANSIAAQITMLTQKVTASGKKWIDNHLNSGSSTYLLNAVLPNMLSREETLAYLNKFTGRAKNQITTAMLSGLTGSRAQWIDKQAPDFSQPDAKGKVSSLADFKGKYVLVDFWASWCTPCKAEIAELKSVYEKFKDKNFTIVSISLDKDKEKWLQSITEEQMPWLQLSDLKAEQNSAVLAYKVQGIPANFLIDPTGKIVGVGFRDGTNPGSKALENTLIRLLK
ncbi:Thiol:disulfide interchange protein TlpA [compost metagenome]|uniref:TlpA disulfide reductase family protein n=1 Tax=Pedobacter sp. ok626 TaxID=1761882 RepID=UPI000892638F|nr:TlpA disulfide reductase family protein [Pedobacter sp. ok626]SDL39113.1 Peroxiredoxin [Pedobacter sp. ok626]